MHADYKKNLEALATAVSEHPFNMTRAADYLRRWCRGEAVHAPLLDTGFFLGDHASGSARLPRNPADALRARAVQPDPANVRVIVARQRQNVVAATTVKMSFVNLVATDLRRQGNSWQDAYRLAQRMWQRMGDGLTAALERSFDELADPGLRQRECYGKCRVSPK